MMEIPIVVAAFNRDLCLTRLLNSLNRAKFDNDVKLIISIDGGGLAEVLKISERFEWEHGTKELIYHKSNLGLREHILFCGFLSSNYDGIILLEDDLYVSKQFYQYVQAAATYYSSDENIGGISLYSQRINETARLPFRAIQDGFDCYFMQLTCSWGQCWLKHHWTRFAEWYQSNGSIELSDTDESIPPDIRLWPQTSWKKYFTKYLIENNLYFVYPRNSYTSNIGDLGIHHRGTKVFQVPLQFVEQDIKLISFNESMVKYDSYLEIIPSCLKFFAPQLSEYDFDVDLYGMKKNVYSKNTHVITTKPCTGPKKSFGRVMKPHEMNIIEDYPGDDIFLVKKNRVEDYLNYNTHNLAVSGDYSNVHPYYYSIYPHQYHLIRKDCSEEISYTFKNSWTFRIGSLITKPIAAILKLLKRINKRNEN